MHQLLRRQSLVVLLGEITLAGCGGSDLTLPTETGPAVISKFDGDNQTGPVGAALGVPLVVEVVDQRGNPIRDLRVAFAVDGGSLGASVSPAEATTDPRGHAEAQWVLGPTSGSQAVHARVVGVDGLEVTFGASATAGAAASIERAEGDEQSAAVGTPLPNPLIVLVTDQFGNPVANVPVEWNTENGSVDPSSTVTGPDGRAQTSWLLGSSTGTHSVTASSTDLEGSPVTFTGTAVPGSAASLVRVSGNNQSGGTGQELDEALVVRLVDSDGNGIQNRPVSWVVGAGAGSVSSATTTTDGAGETQVRWTLGANPGTNTVNAVVSGVGVVGFTATATNGGGGGGGGGGGSSASRLAFRVQPSNVEEDRRISPPVEVVVLDRDGNQVTDEEFEIKLELRGDDDGKLKGDRRERTHSGVASFDNLEVDKDGDYRLHASADGLSSVDSDRFHVRERD
jgi:Big-like domain-containing protein